MKKIINVSNISKHFQVGKQVVKALRSITISIDKNEYVAFMGPSGSGKSTLLNILGTLDSDFSGSLKIDDVYITDSVDLPSIRRRKLGFIFQFHHLLPDFTVLENLLIPQMINESCHNNKQNIIIDMLRYINLEDRIDHYPNEISGGERQRVAVMRALVNSPCIVFADEPTGNLDRDNSQKMLKLMAKLKVNYKQSFIIATHDQSTLAIADRVLYLKDGKITKEI